jgi:putative Holliday junction resolvase
MTKYLGIDYGRARIGIAISDSGIMARPLCQIPNKGTVRNVAAIKDVFLRHFGAEYTISCGCLFGIPLYADGAESEMAREVRAFAETVGRELGVRIEFQNEFMTSRQAEEYLRGTMGIRDQKKVKELIDAAAAAVILNEYLEKKKGEIR